MLNAIHSLRFVFVTLIVLSHIIGRGFDFGGECGVAFFFILSGFVLSKAYGDNIREGRFSTRAFVGKQLLKFYPLHLLTMVLVLLMDTRIGIHIEWTKAIPSLLLVQSWIPDERVYFFANGPAWFLSDITFFYLAFSALFIILNRLSAKRLTILCLCVMVCYILFASVIPEEKVNTGLYIFPLTRIIDFAIGILLFRFYRSEEGEALKRWLKKRNSVECSLMEVAVVAVVVLTAFVYPHLSPRIRCAALFWIPISLSVCFFAMADKCGGAITRGLSSKAMISLGSISFEIYMLHTIVMRIVESVAMHAGKEICLQQPLKSVIIMVLAIAVSYPVKIFFVDKIYRKAANGRYIDKHQKK